MNTQKLKGLIVMHDGTQENLANALGISRSRLNAKMSQKDAAHFKESEIFFIKTRYHLSDAEADEIFLSD